MSGADNVAGQFEAELVRLYDAAGHPSQAELIRQAAKQPRPLRLKPQSVSDWLGGRAIPDDDNVVRFLVAYLQAIAKRQSGYQPPRFQDWRSLAEASRTAKRSGAPARGRTPTRLLTTVSTWPLVRELGPLEMGVHPAAYLPSSTSPLALWLEARSQARTVPAYVPRDHDRELAEALDAVRRRGSGVVLVVGRSCTGKSRSAWQAVSAAFSGWFLVDVRDHRQRERLAAGDSPVGDCILWLDNAHLSDDVPGVVAAAIAALNAPATGQRIVVATMWRQPELDGPGRPLRDLAKLAGVPVHVAERWTAREEDLARTLAGPDALLMSALAQPGYSPPQVLAGAKWALGLWRTPRFRETTALLNAVIDLAGVGVGIPGGPPLTGALLEQCTPPYLSRPPDDRDWYQRALDEATTPLEDALRALTPPTTPDDGYRLFDPLLDYARRERWHELLPAAAWAALAAADLGREHALRLAATAQHRLLLREAAAIEQRAASMAPARSSVPPRSTAPEPREAAPTPLTTATSTEAALSQPTTVDMVASDAEPSIPRPLRLSLTNTDRGRADRLLEADDLEELRALAVRSNDSYIRRRLARLYERRGDRRSLRELATFSNRGARHYVELLCEEGDITELLRLAASGEGFALRALNGWQITGLNDTERQLILTVGLTPDGRVCDPPDET
ncbi:hypothetical protein [Hamadaea tsunoensis]|uniref:hypothetical protein n=1 Tax=Hamadaea tsunoensis TaxID=53368 RepID=UPI00042118EF|nr:hypothetical protein [Hamadaea tsunoensis]